MPISDILKPKTDEEIENILEKLSREEIMQLGYKNSNRDICKYGIEKCGTKVFALDYNESSIEFFDVVNLQRFFEITSFSDNDHLVNVKRISDYKEDDYAILFFASNFTPIYPDNKILNKTKQNLDNIFNALKQK